MVGLVAHHDTVIDVVGDVLNLSDQVADFFDVFFFADVGVHNQYGLRLYELETNGFNYISHKCYWLFCLTNLQKN